MTQEKPAFVRRYEQYTLEDTIEGYKTLHPIPAKEELQDIYDHHYYDNHYPGWVEKTLCEQPYWELAFADRLEIMERYITDGPRRLLDVGSFLGIFLNVAKERGWDALGIEPASQGVEHAHKQGLECKQGFFETFSVEELGQFDAVNLALTLEHVADPKQVLRHAYDMLKPGGIICIEVPNDYSPLQQAVKETLGTSDYWYAPPHHINYFNFENLPKVFENCGFTVVDKTATFPMELFLLMGDHYLGNDEIGRACHQRRMDLETRLHQAGLSGFKQRLYKFLADEGMGRETILFGQKPAWAPTTIFGLSVAASCKYH